MKIKLCEVKLFFRERKVLYQNMPSCWLSLELEAVHLVNNKQTYSVPAMCRSLVKPLIIHKQTNKLAYSSKEGTLQGSTDH